MPLPPIELDDRRYQDLVDEALARIPIHNPEWTNHGRSDPGVTLIELFAFMTESLLYRCNQIPERNRRAFLSLLGVPLHPGSAATALVELRNERGPLEAVTLPAEMELRAGEVPFRTRAGFDLLPIEAAAFFKREVTPTEQMRGYYRDLYLSHQQASETASLRLYETVPLGPPTLEGVDVGAEALDRTLWIALLARPKDDLEAARRAIAGRILSLGVTPVPAPELRRLPAVGSEPARLDTFEVSIPVVSVATPDVRRPVYVPLEVLPTGDVLREPGVLHVRLPASASELRSWPGVGALDAGVGGMPPPLTESSLEERLITWLRVRWAAGTPVRLRAVGINAVLADQRVAVVAEPLADGTGDPDQTRALARPPIIPGSVRLTVGGEPWAEVDDLMNVGAEGQGAADASRVFTVDAESGQIRFGDGFHGTRPPRGARMRASYHSGLGEAGNVGAGSINTGPTLPPGVKAQNPQAAWGGRSPESVGKAEQRIPGYLRHRDRAVTAADFEAIAAAAPNIELARVDVLPAWHPLLSPNQPGDAPGAVTLMVVPRVDVDHPWTPAPDPAFLSAICAHVDPRRLVTTEVFVRGPEYRGVSISIGVGLVAGTQSPSDVRDAVRTAVLRFLSSVPQGPGEGPAPGGWPRNRPVRAAELAAVASRVSGVELVHWPVLLAGADGQPVDEVPMAGLALPRVTALSVVEGDPVPLDQLLGPPGPVEEASTALPVPVVPDECR